MIKSTHPDFERMVAGETIPASDLLLGFLRDAGVPHEAMPAGVRLDTGLELLDPGKIRVGLTGAVSEDLLHGLNIEVHRVIGSTNDTVMDRLSESDCVSLLCTAEMQTAGKGRRGRNWVSPFGRNIYVTYGRFLQRELSDLGGLSVVVGMQAIDALRHLGLKDAALKWPNDLLLQGGKLGGILVELKPQESRGIGIVAGMGVNFLLSDEDAQKIDQAWSVVGEKLTISRNQFLTEFSARLINAIEQFDQEGFAPFAQTWPSYDAYRGELVRVIRGDAVFEGINTGIDGEGNLLIETADGIQAHNAGEVSMRVST